jgi:hypothetical protein
MIPLYKSSKSNSLNDTYSTNYTYSTNDTNSTNVTKKYRLNEGLIAVINDTALDADLAKSAIQRLVEDNTLSSKFLATVGSQVNSLV